MPPQAQAQMSAAIGEDDPAYHVVAGPGGLRMSSGDGTVSAEFTPADVSFRYGVHRWGMALRGYGYGTTLHGTRETTPTGARNRVEYRRGALTEWYVNGPLGLEQGFTLERAPAERDGEPLTLALEMSGDLTASVDPGGRSLTLRKEGAAALRYTGLFAVDADGRELRTWLEVAGADLRVRVDDAAARYPVTVDPYVTGTMLSMAKPCDQTGVCDDGAQFDHFGHSVSVSADGSTVVIGAPYKYNNNARTGVAYVFVRPALGWHMPPNYFTAKLRASDHATNDLSLGFAVAVSHDGGTIVAGAPSHWHSFQFPSGAAYVFTRPPNGWGTIPVQAETAKLFPAPLPGGVSNRSFGDAVAISGNGGTIAVGAPGVDSQAGATYVFLRPASGWVSTNAAWKINGTPGSWFGFPVALSDDASTLVVGAIGESPLGAAPSSGAVHVLERQNTPIPSYAAAVRLAASDGIPHDFLGSSLGVSGDGGTIVAGAPGDEIEFPVSHGAAYVFVRPAGGWSTAGPLLIETAKLTTSDGNGTDALGVSTAISLDGSTIVATTGTRANGVWSRAAYFFAKPAAGWSTASEDAKVMSPGGGDDAFGGSTSLSADGGVAVIGAHGTEFYGAIFQGAAYLFTGSAATPKASISPSSVTFGSQPIGTTSAPQIVTVTNAGSAPLHVAGVSVSGSFSATANCVSASPIAPGNSCAESVTFTPSSVGFHGGGLSFTSNSGGTTGVILGVTLQGSGDPATSTTITSAPAQVFVGQPVFVSWAVTSGTFTPFGPVTVQASTGESCSAGTISPGCTLIFSSHGDRTITASYHGNGNFNPSTSVPVVVKVGDFSLSASPSSQTLAGRKAQYRLDVNALGGFSGNVSLSCAAGPQDQSVCTVSPDAVTVSGSAVRTKATVTLPPGAPNGTYTVTFVGTSGGVVRSTTATLVVK